MIEQFRSRQFFAFLVTGGLAALVNFGSRIVYSHWLDFSTAVILAYLTGMVTAFVLARLFVFGGSRRAWHHSALYFGLVNVAAVLQTWLISLGLANHLFPAIGLHRFPAEVAHAIGIVVPVFTSYIGHKKWSFG